MLKKKYPKRQELALEPTNVTPVMRISAKVQPSDKAAPQKIDYKLSETISQLLQDRDYSAAIKEIEAESKNRRENRLHAFHARTRGVFGRSTMIR